MFLHSWLSLSFAFFASCLERCALCCEVRWSATIPFAPNLVHTAWFPVFCHLFLFVFVFSPFHFSLQANSNSVIAQMAELSIIIVQSSYVNETSWPSIWHILEQVGQFKKLFKLVRLSRFKGFTQFVVFCQFKFLSLLKVLFTNYFYLLSFFCFSCMLLLCWLPLLHNFIAVKSHPFVLDKILVFIADNSE